MIVAADTSEFDNFDKTRLLNSLVGTYTVSQKVIHQTHGDNFVSSKRIFKILSLLEKELNFQQKSYNTFHHTFSM